MYTIYASSKTSSQRHSKMPKLFPSPKPTIHLTPASTDLSLCFLSYLSLLKGTSTNTYSEIWKTINSSTTINPDSVLIIPVILPKRDYVMAACLLLIVQKWLARSFLTSKKLLILWITLFFLRSSHLTSKTLHYSLFSFLSYKPVTICFP